MMGKEYLVGIASFLLVTGPAHAEIVDVSSSTLAGSAGSYTGLDANGTTIDVSYSLGGSLGTITGGQYEGLYFGGNQGSASYTFGFNQQLSYFEFEANALSTFDQYVETIGAFTTNALSPAALTFTNVQYTAFDGTTVTSGPLDNGDFKMAFTAAAGTSFNTISFYHFQANNPNGSVVRDIKYALADGGMGGVPEPTTWAMFVAGFGIVGAVMRRREWSRLDLAELLPV